MPGRLVAGRNEDADRPIHTAPGRLDRRAPAGGTSQTGQAQRPPASARISMPTRHHGAADATRSATMRALIATSGRPPPGWLDPPTRYSPRQRVRFAGRRNAARHPLDDVP